MFHVPLLRSILDGFIRLGLREIFSSSGQSFLRLCLRHGMLRFGSGSSLGWGNSCFACLWPIEAGLAGPGLHSSLFVVPKASGVFRPVLDLPTLSTFVPKTPFQVQTVFIWLSKSPATVPEGVASVK